MIEPIFKRLFSLASTSHAGFLALLNDYATTLSTLTGDSVESIKARVEADTIKRFNKIIRRV